MSTSPLDPTGKGVLWCDNCAEYVKVKRYRSRVVQEEQFHGCWLCDGQFCVCGYGKRAPYVTVKIERGTCPNCPVPVLVKTTLD